MAKVQLHASHIHLTSAPSLLASTIAFAVVRCCRRTAPLCLEQPATAALCRRSAIILAVGTIVHGWLALGRRGASQLHQRMRVGPLKL